jgi:hypothetical protein
VWRREEEEIWNRRENRQYITMDMKNGEDSAYYPYYSCMRLVRSIARVEAGTRQWNSQLTWWINLIVRKYFDDESPGTTRCWFFVLFWIFEPSPSKRSLLLSLHIWYHRVSASRSGGHL